MKPHTSIGKYLNETRFDPSLLKMFLFAAIASGGANAAVQWYQNKYKQRLVSPAETMLVSTSAGLVVYLVMFLLFHYTV